MGGKHNRWTDVQENGVHASAGALTSHTLAHIGTHSRFNSAKDIETIAATTFIASVAGIKGVCGRNREQGTVPCARLTRLPGGAQVCFAITPQSYSRSMVIVCSYSAGAAAVTAVLDEHCYRRFITIQGPIDEKK